MTRAMTDALAHRGPDQQGFWDAGPSGPWLGHRRLSIIDLSDAGRQPMIDPGSGVALIYNGECYNFRDLRSELRSTGATFVSGSDTEVILQAYLAWGDECWRRIRGMFALAVWDPRIQQTILVRDRVGIKPLYYRASESGFLFASEVRALLASGIIKPRLNVRALESYVWHGFVAGPDTIISTVEALPPGTIARIDQRGRVIRQDKYWSYPKWRPPADRASARENAESMLRESVSQHLVSDVPVGVFLSGGVDSTVVSTLAALESEQEVATYNIKFEEAQYDESDYARVVAEHLGTQHHEIILTESDFSDQLDPALNSLDQPTFDAINTYFVSRAVRSSGVVVALAGTGGDELFGGYDSFRELPRAARFARAMDPLGHFPRRMLDTVVSGALAKGESEVRAQVRWGKLADLLSTHGALAATYQVAYSLFRRDFQQELLQQPIGLLHWGLDRDRYESQQRSIADQPALVGVSALEVHSFLADRLLPETDSASMASSLEVRVPLLDHEFLEATSSMAIEDRFEPLGKKQFLRRLAEDQFPPSFFERKKAGFELPLAEWTRSTLSNRMDEVFHDLNLILSIGLNPEAVTRLWRAYKRGAPGIYWSRIWSLFVLLTWCQAHRVTLG